MIVFTELTVNIFIRSHCLQFEKKKEINKINYRGRYYEHYCALDAQRSKIQTIVSYIRELFE